MKFLLCLLFLISSLAFGETKLLIVGGGARPAEAMKQFSLLAGADKADILVIPWASESTEGADNIKTELSAFTKGTLEVVPHRLAQKDVERLITRLQNCSGVFFSGGDQNQLMTLMREYKLVDLMRKRFQEGVIFGGTSAGTAIMSNPMLTGKGDLNVLDGTQIELAEGLGLLPQGVIVDQHFIMRSRFNRLAGVILNQKNSLGIAVNEGTSLLVVGKVGRVVGPTQVLVFKKTASNKLEITVLAPNDKVQF